MRCDDDNGDKICYASFIFQSQGVMMIPTAEYTKNGWEKQLAVNHYGHFYLTSKLKEKMASQTEPSRIVAVSSSAHTLGKVIPSDLHFKNGRTYAGYVSYGQSKLANILFAKSLSDELKDTHVRTVSLHPGVIATNLVRYLSSFLKVVVKTLSIILGSDRTIPQGASTTLYGCLCPDFEKQELSGSYLSDCAILAPNVDGQDVDGKLRAELWNTTNEDINKVLAGKDYY